MVFPFYKQTQGQFQIWFGYFKRSKVPSGLGLGSQLWGVDLDPFVQRNLAQFLVNNLNRLWLVLG